MPRMNNPSENMYAFLLSPCFDYDLIKIFGGEYILHLWNMKFINKENAWHLLSAQIADYICCLCYFTLRNKKQNMLCDQPKWVWSRSNSIFIFLIDCIDHLQSYLVQQTPLKLVNWFQKYWQLKGSKNNREQRNYLLRLAIS